MKDIITLKKTLKSSLPSLMLVFLVTNQTLATEVIEPLDCVIEPASSIELTSDVPGVLETVLVKRGEFVKRDQVIAKIESKVERANVTLAQTRVDLEAELAIQLSKTRYEFSQRNLERSKELYQKKYNSLRERDEAETNSLLAELQLKQSKANKTMAEMELMRAQELLARRTIRSPIDGVVVDRLKSPGEYVDNQAIVNLAKIDTLNVETIVPARLFGMIKTGSSAIVTPSIFKNKTYKAKITVVDRVLDASSHTFRVRLVMSNPSFAIPAGLRCSVQF